ncbi:MAG: tyrosine-type recombinase/integrase [Bacteroidetes bacterium]|nr:tyrosine-type recombinase/integrase [Bacteroidota bacterium]
MKHLILNNPSYIKLEEGFREWLEILGYAPVSVVSHPRIMREFFNHLESIGINHIEQVENETVYGYFDYLKGRKKLRDNGALTNSYLNKHLQTIKRFSDYLRDAHKQSFTTDIIGFPVNTPPQVVLHQKEIELLYNAVPNDEYGIRDSVMLDIYYGCGLRKNEGVQLDMEDVLYDRGLLYVRAGKNYTERYVPVNDKILKNIRNYANDARISLLVKDKNEPSLFVSQRGERPTGDSLLLRLKGLKELTGNTVLQSKKIGLHTLRHSIATHLLMGGMKLENVAKFLGHKSIESTQIYTHLAHELQSIP